MNDVLPASPRRPSRLHQLVPGAKGIHNSDDCRQWRSVPGRTFHAVLEHIEGDNEPPLEYSAPERQLCDALDLLLQ
ncbi:hypothetical protein D1007_09504 [Hordeum vulgare]|nr:hypothetical protein D1007_09504 [Hordeum vulgare]